MLRTVPIMGTAELEELSTNALLGRLARLRSLEDTPAGSAWTPEEIADAQGIAFKWTPEWKQANTDPQAILARRENLPSPADRIRSRHARAARNNTTEHRNGR